MRFASARVPMAAAVIGVAVCVFSTATLDHFANLWTAEGIYADEHHSGGEIPGGELWQAAGCVCLLVIGVVAGVAGLVSWMGHRQARP